MQERAQTPNSRRLCFVDVFGKYFWREKLGRARNGRVDAISVEFGCAAEIDQFYFKSFGVDHNVFVFDVAMKNGRGRERLADFHDLNLKLENFFRKFKDPKKS